jgi:YVTN family beta-propeller protein
VTINGNHLFVTDMSSGDVYSVSLSLDRPQSVAEVSVFSTKPVPHGIAVDPTTQLAFVSRSETNMVDVFAPDTMRRVSSISVPDGPDGIFYDQFDGLIYVANSDAGAATLIDPATKTKVGVIPLRGQPEYAVFDPQTSLASNNSLVARSRTTSTKMSRVRPT